MPRQRSSDIAPATSTEILRIIPLGGVGEIGKNLTVIEYGDSMSS